MEMRTITFLAPNGCEDQIRSIAAMLDRESHGPVTIAGNTITVQDHRCERTALVRTMARRLLLEEQKI